MKKKNLKIGLVCSIISASLLVYYGKGSADALWSQNGKQVVESPLVVTAEQYRLQKIDNIQQQLYSDKQNAKLWYQLGHAYLFDAQYENAVTVFDYAIRLTDTISADHYAAKASAVYYSNKQQLTEQVDTLLKQSLALDKNNQTALMMLANEQFMQTSYQKAIDIWVQLLDSEQQNLDRVTIIHRINQAKQLLKARN